MKKTSRLLLTLVTLIGFSAGVYALDFKAGEYYFDNSKLHFNNVKMVMGGDDSVVVRDMMPQQSVPWLCSSLSMDVTNLKGFCFINSTIDAGTYYESLDNFLERVAASSANFRQTKVRESIGREPQHLIGWVFCPLNDFEISDGYWRTQDSYNIQPSLTVPLIHINTQDGVTIADKENYIDATFWLDNCGIEGYESMGSEEEPLSIEIKGRGNYTWRESYKKPYKIKFAQKQMPLGLDHSKHFILKPDFMDWSGYLRNETGFEISRQLGMPYTTRQYPVELVLNGEYQGLYFLCEKIRVENGRVDIIEQQDNETNPDNVTGGWLLELGYEDNQVIAQFQGNDPSNSWFAFMAESPEVLSQVQRDYIHDFIFQADSCLFVTDKTDTGWEQYFDINSMARFYVIHEVMENVEAFSGSLFMYKDWGEDQKLKFGPVWDFDNSGFNTTGDHFIFQYDTFFSFLWIEEFLKFPHFQQVVRQVWREFKNNDVLSKINEHAAQWRSLIIAAEDCDKVRWRSYASIHPEEYVTDYLNLIARKVAWLDEQWSVPVGDVNCDGHVNSVDVTVLYSYLLGDDDSSSYRYTCDVDGDGHISSVDITAIYNILLNGNPALPSN